MIRAGYHRIYINAGVDERCVIIPVQAEGADMPTGKTKSRCAWEAVNAPAMAMADKLRRSSGWNRLRRGYGGSSALLEYAVMHGDVKAVWRVYALRTMQAEAESPAPNPARRKRPFLPVRASAIGTEQEPGFANSPPQVTSAS